MNLLVCLVAGLIFGIGLMVSGMADPAKVLGFLDLAGNWDPSLALVMAGAVAIAFIGFRIARTQRRPLLGPAMHLPSVRHIDRSLIIGSALFGIGWGLAGFCPGPALVALGMGHAKALIFALAMLAGMGIFELVQRRGRSAAARKKGA